MVTVADESSVVLRCASSKALRDKALRLYRRRHEKTGVIARFGHGPSAAIAGAAWTDGWMRASGRSTTPGSTAGGGAIPRQRGLPRGWISAGRRHVDGEPLRAGGRWNSCLGPLPPGAGQRVAAGLRAGGAAVAFARRAVLCPARTHRRCGRAAAVDSGGTGTGGRRSRRPARHVVADQYGGQSAEAGVAAACRWSGSAVGTACTGRERSSPDLDGTDLRRSWCKATAHQRGRARSATPDLSWCFQAATGVRRGRLRDGRRFRHSHDQSRQLPTSGGCAVHGLACDLGDAGGHVSRLRERNSLSSSRAAGLHLCFRPVA